MAEATQEQLPLPQAPSGPITEDLPDEEIMARALGEKPRDPATGRFLSEKPEAPAEEKPAAENTEEKPAEEAKPDEAAEEQPKWDDLKNVKLKIPMKQGDKEWEEELSLEQLREE